MEEPEEGGFNKMKNKMFILLIFSVLLFSPNLAVSDCADFSRVTSWYVQGENTIIFYGQNAPVPLPTLRISR